MSIRNHFHHHNWLVYKTIKSLIYMRKVWKSGLWVIHLIMDDGEDISMLHCQHMAVGIIQHSRDPLRYKVVSQFLCPQVWWKQTSCTSCPKLLQLSHWPFRAKLSPCFFVEYFGNDSLQILLNFVRDTLFRLSWKFTVFKPSKESFHSQEDWRHLDTILSPLSIFLALWGKWIVDYTSTIHKIVVAAMYESTASLFKDCCDDQQ